MSEMRPIRTPNRPGSSLLERAAQVYDFGAPFVPVLTPDAPIDGVPMALPPVSQPVEQPQPLDTPQVPPIDEPSPIAPDAPRIAVATLRAPVPAGGGAVIDRDNLAEQGMLVPGAPIGPLAEEFRLVKRQLLNTARAIGPELGDRARLILVCSANPNEGKTYCAINLALSLAAERETEVLLVDADFAKPDVLKRLGVTEAPGLLDVLADPKARIEDYVIPTDVPQLSLLPAGRKSNNDTELLASERTRVLLDALITANPRRIIVFDSPPALAASPAATLAHHVGQVMLVVRADKTPDGDLRAAVNLLDGCEHIQLILNAVSFAPGGRRFGSYYGQESLT